MRYASLHVVDRRPSSPCGYCLRRELEMVGQNGDWSELETGKNKWTLIERLSAE